MPEMVSQNVGSCAAMWGWFRRWASGYWGLSGCAMSDVEKWAPVGNPLTSRPSLWASSLACGNGGGAWSPVGHVPGLAPLGAWSRL